jgi:hypothetical protein
LRSGYAAPLDFEIFVGTDFYKRGEPLALTGDATHSFVCQRFMH